MEYNECKTCKAKGGRCGTLFNYECLNCYDTRNSGKGVVIHADLKRTKEEIQRTMAIHKDKLIIPQLIDRKCAVVVTNANGEPDLWFVKVQCTEEEFENGDHYQGAINHAEDNGNEAGVGAIVFDETCPAREILNLFAWETASTVDVKGSEIFS